MRLNCNEMMQDVRESATRSTKRGGEEEEWEEVIKKWALEDDRNRYTAFYPGNRMG